MPRLFIACPRGLRITRTLAVVLVALGMAMGNLSHGLTPAKDGDRTVASGSVVVNEYAPLAANAATGDFYVSVANVATALPSLTVGDLILIYQAQGATIDTTNALAYGTVTDLGSAGRYEFHTVSSIDTASSPNRVYFANDCTGCTVAYTTAGHAQVIRVPQYRNLTVNAGASIVASTWNGSTGGVVAIHVADTTTLNGSINVTGRGFRGGVVVNDSSAPLNITIYRSSNLTDGGEKGESIAGHASTLANGRYGRGAPANGGGGGNSHNNAGGGGANGNNGNSWTVSNGTMGGQGVMNQSTTVWRRAWRLDPAYTANGSAYTNCSGGGRGGYSWSDADQDETRVAPGNSGWGGDSRRVNCGLGGRPLNNDPASVLFLGGGGGAAHMNNNSGSGAGNGGGLVFLISNTVTGSGSVLADGADGGDCVDTYPNDAAGGGGGGGTIAVLAGSLSGVSLNARGGLGGDQPYTNHNGYYEAEGPGGGGGGGYIAYSGGAVTTSAAGGANGITTSRVMPNFQHNGATSGASGQTDQPISTLQLCDGVVTGHVFYDFNQNGVEDTLEVPVPNLDVVVTLSGGETLTRQTDEHGNYYAGVPYGLTVASVRVSGFPLPPAARVTTGNNQVQTVTVPAGINGAATPVGFSSDPLLVDLESFTAEASTLDRLVTLRWTTAAELDNAGFHVYRGGVNPEGDFGPGERLSTYMIPAEGSEVAGANYQFVDPSSLAPGELRWYYLEDTDLSGQATFHGPVGITLAAERSPAARVGDWVLYPGSPGAAR